MKATEIDELDRQLIVEIIADPRRSYVALGKTLGVSGTTVATRLERLRAAGLLLFRASPDLDEFGLGTEIWGTIQTETSALAGVTRLLNDSPSVLRVDQITGEFNLSFLAAFSSDDALGTFLRQLQSIDGVRRFVVHHILETVKDASGWETVFAEGQEPLPAPAYEIVPGTNVPPRLEAHLATAAAWITALVAGDVERLRQLSSDDIVYEIVRPRSAAGTFEGLAGVEDRARVSKKTYRSFWYRVVGVAEAQPPYTLVVDALSPLELTDGQVLTGFSRLAFAIKDGQVSLVKSLGQMNLEDVSADVAAQAPSG